MAAHICIERQIIYSLNVFTKYTSLSVKFWFVENVPPLLKNSIIPHYTSKKGQAVPTKEEKLSIVKKKLTQQDWSSIKFTNLIRSEDF